QPEVGRADRPPRRPVRRSPTGARRAARHRAARAGLRRAWAPFARRARGPRADGAELALLVEEGEEGARLQDPAARAHARRVDRVVARADRGGRVPVGCVIAHEGEVIAAAPNERELRGDPTAHCEILALREAARALGHWRLSGTVMYVTLEPCAMCAGAVVLSRVQRVVYGAEDPK